jgi:F-type H+-transporting ATPase subunit b
MPHFVLDPTFWVAVSFLVFVALAFKPIASFIVNALDARSERIAKELREAVALREEAQSLLAEYQKKQRENMDEAKRIVEQTKADAQAMAERAEQELRDTLDKRKALAMDKIAQAEVTAVKMVQQNVVDIALAASRETLAENDNASKLLDEALDDIEKQLA